MPSLWSPADLANFLGVPVETVYGWRKNGSGPPGRRVGKHVRYRPADVEAWFDQLPEGVA